MNSNLLLTLLISVILLAGCTDKVPQGKPNIEGKQVRGGDNSSVTIVEFSDFQCPVCLRSYLANKEIEAQYGDRISFYFKQFPLREMHPQAQKAAEASECAAAQGKFWEMHDILYQNQNALDIASMKNHAQQLGLDTSAFNACLDSGSTAAAVQKDFEEGIALGIGGTPTYFINNKAYVGYMNADQLKQIIDAGLSSASK